MVFGKGLNDTQSQCLTTAYVTWHSMLRRCYSDVYHKDKPTYVGVEACKDWLRLSVFKEWFDLNYVEGWHLDKDLVGGGREYSPDNCCFLPPEINAAIATSRPKRGMPTGVYFKKRNQKFCAQLSVIEGGKRVSGYLGLYSSAAEAEASYKEAKGLYFRELAEKWRSKLSERAYEALVKVR